jgi:hypothetical protein
MRLAALCFVTASLSSIACDSPIAPDSRSGYLGINVVCDDGGASPLVCRALSYCSGIYPCRNPEAHGGDFTDRVEWTTPGDVVRLVGPGRLEAVAVGDTVITATLRGIAEAKRSITVFAGYPPLPTYEILGSVLDAEKPPGMDAIPGATVQVLNGLIAGRTVITGVPPGSAYRIVGAPAATYRLRVSAPGYVAVEHEVTVGAAGVGNTTVRLRPERG